jgi:hypothetical protein
MSKPRRTKDPEQGAAGSRRPELSDPAGIPSVLPEQLLREISDALGPQKVQQLESVIFRYATYRGEWPPVELIAEWEAALPGLGTTIVASIKARSEARAVADKEHAMRADARMDRGQYFGFSIALLSIMGAVYIATLPASPTTAIIPTVLLVAGIGGPSVARVLADQIYLRNTQVPPRADRSNN